MTIRTRIDPSIGQRALADMDRRAFLQRLYDAPFSVTDWEAQFIADHLDQPRPFTDAQRQAIDQMRERYEHRL